VSSSLVPALVVAGVMAVILAVSMVLLSRAGGKAEARADELRADVERRGEQWVVPLKGTVYEHGPGPRGNRGHGILGLTDARLLFLPIAGERLSVPRARIASARVQDRRRDAAAGHRHLLVLTLDDDSELAFLVDDAGAWEQALGATAGSGGPEKAQSQDPAQSRDPAKS
jgi:hypothetical protein